MNVSKAVLITGCSSGIGWATRRTPRGRGLEGRLRQEPLRRHTFGAPVHAAQASPARQDPGHGLENGPSSPGDDRAAVFVQFGLPLGRALGVLLSVTLERNTVTLLQVGDQAPLRITSRAVE
jgi:NAD(P)-dependent dehydrogenase (short-subunit alcohol dehydrogenase family)